MFWQIRNRSTYGSLRRWNEVHLCTVIRRLNFSTLPMRCHLATVTFLVPFQLMFGISKGSKVICRLSTANEAHRISILDNLPLSSCLLRNVNVSSHIQSSPALVFILRQTSSFHISTTYFFRIHSLTLAAYFQMGFPGPLFPSGFQIVRKCQLLHPSTHVILISKFILSSWQQLSKSRHIIYQPSQYTIVSSLLSTTGKTICIRLYDLGHTAP